jgi:spore maturation protein CgeB
MEAVGAICADAARADVVVKASGIGVLDDEILATLLAVVGTDKVRVFWDVDAPATLAAIASHARHPLRGALRHLDAVLTYGGGAPVVAAYEAVGARVCLPIYNALDSQTHFRVAADPRYEADLAFLGNRLPDREARVNDFFFVAARELPERTFLLGGAGWEPWQLPANVRGIGHVATCEHNAFNSTPLAIINIARDSMAAVGYSPATRIFEAAGAGACIITDIWNGIELFLEPGQEVLVARDGNGVAQHLAALTPEHARLVGERARQRIQREHTYDKRALSVVRLFDDLLAAKHRKAVA